MGAFSPTERAWRIYSQDKKDGKHSGRTMLENWVSNSRFVFYTGAACLLTAAFLFSLLLNGEATGFKIFLGLVLGYFALSSFFACIFYGLSFVEDSKLLKIYRSIESANEENANE